MKVENKVVKEVSLTLTPNEANWLKGIMQNPLHDQSPEEEDSFDSEMRFKFFHALEWNK